MKKRPYTRKIWTDNEQKILTDMYPDHYTAEICRILGRTLSSVYARATILGLKKSEAFRNMELQRQAERLNRVSAEHRFKKGRTPENKGQKMSPEVYEKVKRTMFKKGSVPANINYDGHQRISVEGYTEMRIRPGKYILLHRYLWEQTHGPIPAGYICVFKDNNSQNLALENLELITREENMKRNTIHRFPAELKSAIRLVNKLKRKTSEK